MNSSWNDPDRASTVASGEAVPRDTKVLEELRFLSSHDPLYGEVFARAASALQASEQALVLALDTITAMIEVASEARDEWDAAPQGMRAGKLLIALCGSMKGYRHDIDAIHANRDKLYALAKAVDAAPLGGEGEGFRNSSARNHTTTDAARADALSPPDDGVA